jgi:hypothetical protein
MEVTGKILGFLLLVLILEGVSRVRKRKWEAIRAKGRSRFLLMVGITGALLSPFLLGWNVAVNVISGEEKIVNILLPVGLGAAAAVIWGNMFWIRAEKKYKYLTSDLGTMVARKPVIPENA